jgi:hypothetical protein
VNDLRRPLLPLQCQPPIVPAKPLAAAVAAGDVIGPQAHRQDTANVGALIDGEPVATGMTVRVMVELRMGSHPVTRGFPRTIDLFHT